MNYEIDTYLKIHFRSMDFEFMIIDKFISNYIRFVKDFQKAYYVNMEHKIIYFNIFKNIIKYLYNYFILL